MQSTIQQCVDCGSRDSRIIINEINSAFRLKQIHFACGAVLTSSFNIFAKIGKISHEGCRAEEQASCTTVHPVPPPCR